MSKTFKTRQNKRRKTKSSKITTKRFEQLETEPVQIN